jgi:hypothetical protein
MNTVDATKKNESAGAPDTRSTAAIPRKKWLQLFINGKQEALSNEFLSLLDHFSKVQRSNLTAEDRAFVNDFVENFLYFFCHPEFTVPANHVQSYLGFHPIISNVVALSDFGTTTPWVARLARRKESYFKLLTLYNVRCGIDIDPALLFEVSPFLASQWWAYFWNSAPAFCTKATHGKIRGHLMGIDHRFMIFGEGARASYFPVTYVAPESEYVNKRRLSDLAGDAFANVKIRNRPNRRKIAIVSDRWYRSAVYTSLSPLIRSLHGRYDLTLVHSGTDEGNIMDRDTFERTIRIQMRNSQMDLEPLQDNEFSAAVFPDVGMNPESIFLATIRIAPVQIAMYGHPTSSWSRNIDYFLGGRKVESLENAERDYSERLVTIPGMGVYPVIPDDFTLPPERTDEKQLLINCGWTAQKVSYPLLCALQKIIAGSTREIAFQIFAGSAVSHYGGFIPFVKDLHSMLGEKAVRVMPSIRRHDYLAELCKGSFSIDSYPFGGFNTVIDALYCKKPMVVWQGERAFNRFGAATLDIVGVPELIAHSEDEYISLSLRLINDDGFRQSMRTKVSAIDLKAAFAAQEDPTGFLRAMDFLIDNHDRLKAENSKAPILIA